MKSKPCNKCDEPIIFLKSIWPKGDGKPKWIAVDAAGVGAFDEVGRQFSQSRHAKFIHRCGKSNATEPPRDVPGRLEGLRRCPLCGSEDVVVRLFSDGEAYAQCNGCELQTGVLHTEADLRRLWNTRFQ